MGSATYVVNVQPNERQRLVSSSERWQPEKCDRNCVTRAQQQAPAWREAQTKARAMDAELRGRSWTHHMVLFYSSVQGL